MIKGFTEGCILNINMFKQFVLLSLNSIRYRPLRSWLTVLGIVIGIMLVVVILSLGNGIEHAISGMLQMFGSDLVIIYPGKETNPVAGLFGGVRFKESDLLDLEKINGVRYVVPVDVATLNVDFEGEKDSVMVHAAPMNKMSRVMEESRGVKLLSGAWPATEDSREVVLGYLMATKLFRRELRVGDEIIVRSKILQVGGILASTGAQDDDNSMYISSVVYRQITNTPPRAISAMVRTDPSGNLNLIAEQIKFQLHKQDEVRDFSVLTPSKVMRVIGSVLSVVEFALMVIALVSLLVGAVGIMNTMYTAVLEKTKQIGIMKAVGATSDVILSLFLFESGLIGAVGGILGILFGVMVSAGIGALAGTAGISGIFSLESLDYLGLSAVLVLTFIVGIVAGYLPAKQASKMEPAEALRYE